MESADAQARRAAHLESLWQRWRARGGTRAANLLIVTIAEQMLYLLEHGSVRARYAVSTSRFGQGCEEGSRQTPTGWHSVAAKIGAGEPVGTVFVGREPVRAGGPRPAAEDTITSRILWLEGLEPGHNSGPGRDSRARYIYIHGTPEEDAIGTPASIGCIRMRNCDVVELFDAVEEGTPVVIEA